jgi:hypothetical protein
VIACHTSYDPPSVVIDNENGDTASTSGNVSCDSRPDWLQIEVCLQARYTSGETYFDVACRSAWDEYGQGSAYGVLTTYCLKGTYRYRTWVQSKGSHGGAEFTKTKAGYASTFNCPNGAVPDDSVFLHGDNTPDGTESDENISDGYVSSSERSWNILLNYNEITTDGFSVS